jgi:hypothetical protein
VRVEVFQRAVNVIFKRGRKTGSGGDNPAEPGYWGNRVAAATGEGASAIASVHKAISTLV